MISQETRAEYHYNAIIANIHFDGLDGITAYTMGFESSGSGSRQDQFGK